MSKRTRAIAWAAYNALHVVYDRYGIETLQLIGMTVTEGLHASYFAQATYGEIEAVVAAQIEIIEIEHDFQRQKSA